MWILGLKGLKKTAYREEKCDIVMVAKILDHNNKKLKQGQQQQ